MSSQEYLRSAKELLLASLPFEFILNHLVPELQQLVFGFLHPWEIVPHWRHRFTQDVLPGINKGFRLVSRITIDGIVHKCTNCYAYGNNGLCLNCENDEDEFDDLDYMSFEEFAAESRGSNFWTYDTYHNMQFCWFGRQRIRNSIRFENDADPLLVEITSTTIYTNLMLDDKFYLMAGHWRHAMSLGLENEGYSRNMTIDNAYNVMYAQYLERHDLMEEDKTIADIRLLFR